MRSPRLALAVVSETVSSGVACWNVREAAAVNRGAAGIAGRKILAMRLTKPMIPRRFGGNVGCLIRLGLEIYAGSGWVGLGPGDAMCGGMVDDERTGLGGQ